MLWVINPNICSTLALTLDFFLFLCFCRLLSGLFRYPFLLTHLFYCFTSVGTICIQWLSVIFFFGYKLAYHFTIMHTGCCNFISGYQFCFTICFYMILIAKIVFPIVCHPLCICIFLA